jgi:preprotein translocase subunit SecG
VRYTSGAKKCRTAFERVRVDAAPTTLQRVELIFSVLQVVISVVLIFLVLMHSGKDAGLSGAFGVGTGQGPLGGGSLVERNLNRWTIGFAIAFAINTILLLKKPFW